MIEQVHGAENAGQKGQEDAEGEIEQAEGRFQTAQGVLPGDRVVGAELKIGAAEEGGNGGSDQQQADAAVDEEEGVVGFGSQQIARLATVFKAHRLHNEGKEDENPHPVGAPEAGGVEEGESGEKGAAEEDQGGEGEFPFAADGVDDQGFLLLRPGGGGQQGLSPLHEGHEEK